MQNRNPTALRTVYVGGLLLWAVAAACGPALPPPTTPPPAASHSAPQPSSSTSGYARDRDPMSASYDAEKNPYVRRIMARMWIATARIESPGDAVRGETAANALREVELQIGRLTDQCAKDVVAASDWARSAKQGLERKYLTSVDLLGEQNVDTKAIDAQVIVLRDEIEGLERTLQPCPRRYFGPEDQ